MAGQNPAFNAEEFRSGIRFAMQMGAPSASAERATFRWKVTKQFDIADPANRPYNWTAPPDTVSSHPDVQVDCAVEFTSRASSSGGASVGRFNSAQAVITVLDEDFVKIVGASHVLLGGNLYSIDYIAPPEGLFDVTVYTLFASALDES